MENINKAKLAMKIAVISAKMVGITKDGLNTKQQFKYIGYEQINALLSQYMLEQKIVIYPEITEAKKEIYEYKDNFGNNKRITTIHLSGNFEIIDAETGYAEVKRFEAEASDYNDKAFPKATTEFQKRFYAKLFNITSGEIDPDKDTVTIEKSKEGKRKAPAFKPKQQNPFRQEVLTLADTEEKRNIVKELLDKLNYKKLEELKENEKPLFLQELKNRIK